MGECFVSGKQGVPAGQQVALHPALEGVFAEHLHHAAVRGEQAAVAVFGQGLGQPGLMAGLVDCLEAVGRGLVGTEHPEVAHVLAHHVAQQLAQHKSVLGPDASGLGYFHRVVAKVRHPQRLAQGAAVGVRIGAHPALSHRRHFAQLRDQLAVGVEEFLRLVAAHPALQQPQVVRIGLDLGNRYLVGAPEALDLVAVDFRRSGPSLGGAQDDHRPARPHGLAGAARLILEGANLADAILQGRGHLLMHQGGVVALDEVRRVSVAGKQALQLVGRNARENRGVGDLVAVQMQDRQHGAVANRVEKLVGMPRGRHRSGFRFAVANHHRRDQIGIVEHRAETVGEAVAEFAALVDRSRSLRGAMAADSARK